MDIPDASEIMGSLDDDFGHPTLIKVMESLDLGPDCIDAVKNAFEGMPDRPDLGAIRSACVSGMQMYTLSVGVDVSYSFLIAITDTSLSEPNVIKTLSYFRNKQLMTFVPIPIFLWMWLYDWHKKIKYVYISQVLYPVRVNWLHYLDPPGSDLYLLCPKFRTSAVCWQLMRQWFVKTAKRPLRVQSTMDEKRKRKVGLRVWSGQHRSPSKFNWKFMK